MASDLLYAQLLTQSFSSGSSFCNVSNSATANQFRNIIGTHNMNGGESSFESTLHLVTDTKTTSDVPASACGGRAASHDHAELPSGPTDTSQEGLCTDNLLCVSLDHHELGDDGAADSNQFSGINMLMAMLNELQNTFVLNNPSGFQFVQGPDANDTMSIISGNLSITADQMAMSPGLNAGLIEKLEALIKQWGAAGEDKQTPEIRNLIEQFNTVSGGDSANIAKPAEMAKFIRKLAVLSASVTGQWDRPYQTLLPTDSSQTGSMISTEDSRPLNLAKVFTGATHSPLGSSDTIVQHSTSENLNLENKAEGKQVVTRTDMFGMSKAVPGAVNASAQMQGNEQTLSSMPGVNEIKSAIPGQKDIVGLHLDKRPAGEFNQDNPAPVLQAKSSIQQNNATLQNAEVVNLKTEGSSATVLQANSSVQHNNATLQNAKSVNVNMRTDGSFVDAVAGKMANPESGNQENGFSFGGQQQNELGASERAYHTEQSEMVQKKFRAQTLEHIVQKATLHLKNGQNEVQINLKPDFLGQIRMQIITDSQQVTVRILTEFPVVKELIENNAHQLRSELQNHGLDIDELEVSVSQHSDRQVADQNQADSSVGKNSPEKNATADDGTSENSVASSTLSDGQDDDLNTKIDFFA